MTTENLLAKAVMLLLKCYLIIRFLSPNNPVIEQISKFIEETQEAVT